MTEKEIAEWIAKAYEKAKGDADGMLSYEYEITRSEGTTGIISIMTGGKNYSITKQALADALNSDDKLASEIWHWIRP